jgi:hypothetical protein
MKNNHGFSNILIKSLILILLISGGYFLFNYLNKNNEINLIVDSVKPEDELNLIVDSIKLEIENKKPKNLKNIEKDEEGNVWWITEDGYSIIVKSNPTTYVELDTKINRTPVANDFRELTEIVKDKMQNKGFKLSELNSNSEIETDMNSKDYTFYDYIQAYEKAGIKCVATASGDINYSDKDGKDYLSYEFSCTTDEKIKQSYSIQAPFIDLIISDESYPKKGNMDFKRKNIAIQDLTITEDKAIASLGNKRTGWGAHFYKDNNKWKLITQGQSAPPCSDLEKRGVPKKYQEDLCVK